MDIKKKFHTLGCILIALFFIYAGVKKFIPNNKKRTVDNTEIVAAITNNSFEKPIPFRLSVRMLKVSGFLKMIGVLQILSGILIIAPATRAIGLIFLLPITINIFCFHLFMDNRMDENIQTGLILLVNTGLLIPYYQKLKGLINIKISS